MDLNGCKDSGNFHSVRIKCFFLYLDNLSLLKSFITQVFCNKGVKNARLVFSNTTS